MANNGFTGNEVCSPFSFSTVIPLGSLPEDGKYGVDIPKGVWHNIEALEEGSVIFECKEGHSCRMKWKGY